MIDQKQRLKIKSVLKPFVKPKIKKKKIILRKEILELLEKSRNPVLILGAGFAHSKNYFKSLVDLKKLNIKISCTWGGQKVQSLLSKKDNFIGLMGNHNPGIANKYINESDLVISIGCSLLQHQVGKIHNIFAPNAKIIFVNNQLEECKRAKLQFGYLQK